MTTGTQYAAAIRRDLEWLEVHAPEAGAEARRVLNLGIPLADMMHAHMARPTPEGKVHLESTAGDLAAMREVISTDPGYAVMRDHVSMRTGETVLSWVPLWDAMEAERKRQEARLTAARAAMRQLGRELEANSAALGAAMDAAG